VAQGIGMSIEREKAKGAAKNFSRVEKVHEREWGTIRRK